MTSVYREERFSCSRRLHKKHIGSDKGMSNQEVRKALVKKNLFKKNQYTSADVLQFCIDQQFLGWQGNVLDFGCRDGGLFQIMQDLYPECTHFGCDINLVAGDADWLIAAETKADPPLPYESNFFSVITAFSVFSHLTQPSMMAWLYELQRILVPGGQLFFTYCGLRTIEVLSDRHNWSIDKTLDIVMRVHRDNFIWEDIYKKNLLKDHFAGSKHYGLTFIHDITLLCPPGLTVKAILPGRSGHQNVCILEKV